MVAAETGRASQARIIVHGEIDSTNTEVMRLLASGETGPFWVRAERQSQGRGRSGRTWVSEPGNMYASHLVAIDAPLRVAHHLSLVTGIAVLDAIRETMAADVGAALCLKWPNDVLLSGAKCAGILLESMSRPGGGFFAVIGIGVNIAWSPGGLDRAVTHLAARGTAPSPQTLLEHIDVSLTRWLGVWRNGEGFATVREGWLQRAQPLGQSLTINAGEGAATGRFCGIDDDGALRLKIPGVGLRTFTFGDVSIASPPTAETLDR